MKTVDRVPQKAKRPGEAGLFIREFMMENMEIEWMHNGWLKHRMQNQHMKQETNYLL